MPFQNGYGVIKYIFALAGDPDDMIFTVGIQASGALTPSELSGVFDAFADNFLDAMTSSYTFRGIQVVGTEAGGAEYSVELFSNAVGTGGGPELPQNCAILLQKRTGLAGRANRGRAYLVGLAQEGEISAAGVISPTYLGSLQTRASQFRTDLLVSGVTGVADVVVNHPVATPTPVTAFVIDDRIATQRRRMR